MIKSLIHATLLLSLVACTKTAPREIPRAPIKEKPAQAATKTKSPLGATEKESPSNALPVVNPKLPKVAVIIDDIGLRRNGIDVFWADNSLRNRLTWAIIPGTPHAISLANELLAQRESILFHIPMESMDPTRMTASLEPYLRASDSPEKIRTTLTQRLAKLPPEISKHIQGLSNHQGSRFSASHTAMTVLMNELKKRNLFYVDSRTTAQTVADNVAAKQGVAFARRHVFLDNVPEVTAIAVQLKELAELALQQGYAIAVGHPYPQTASALAVWMREQKGILQVVPVHHLVNTP